MIITNKQNIAPAVVKAVTSNMYTPKADSYSATTILKGQTEVLLSRRHDSEITQDVNLMLNMMLGTALHEFFEKYDETGFAELYLKQEVIPGHYLSGMCDIYDAEKEMLIDYKTGTTYKIKFADFDDWYKQGMIYTWLLEKEGKMVKSIEFQCFLKDWSPRDARMDKSYPQSQVYQYSFTPTVEDRLFIDKYIKDWFEKVADLEPLPDNLLPYCGDKNTWYNGDSFAVYEDKDVLDVGVPKPGTKAKRVLKSYVEAEQYISETITKYLEKYTKAKIHPEYKIIKRYGEHRKCQDYCSCCNFCSFYLQAVKKELEGGEK